MESRNRTTEYTIKELQKYLKDTKTALLYQAGSRIKILRQFVRVGNYNTTLVTEYIDVNGSIVQDTCVI